ncbi:hypothetical protein [Hymenobacter volaticus]|uniref:Uncharacterized protein n=1 Tax=Hymenobacter volaticus TaxID=2932254 RepID=A0ABY4G920_9BACT|nr:hypothetical protein [Hymenobacter volaticus]UOQ67246.1 hypothetical protein MUN86_04960 [Hymenobacter volaticus]
MQPILSTQNYAALPDNKTLQRLCKALAVLDAINSPETEYRYHTYDANWDKGEEFFEMNDGEGDQMVVLFKEEGCVINGYADGLEQPDKARVTRGLPEIFDEFVFGEPVNSIGTTFCLWYTPRYGWQTGPLENEEDGSEDMLYIFDNQPQTYIEWATEYFDETEQTLDLKTVSQIYQGEPLTKAMVLALVDNVADWLQLETDLQEIGYPYDFS